MKVLVDVSHSDVSLVCFKHEGLKIEAFKSVANKSFVTVSYGTDSDIYFCNTSIGAYLLAEQLISEYTNKVRSVEKFFDSF